MKKILLGVATAFFLNTSVSADMLGAEAGYVVWNPTLTGSIKKGGDSLDFEKDLGYGSTEANSFMWAYVDHPIPLLPNIKLQKTNYTDSAEGIVTKNLTFAGESFVIADKVKSELTLNQLDTIAYWRILDNWVNFDIGLNIKTIDGQIKLDTTTKHVNESFDIAVPMLYTKARFDLPFSGLSVEADMSYVSYVGNKFSDMKAGVVYETTFGLGATAGLRKLNLTLDDVDGIYGDINIEGMYAGLFFHF
jgi:outer membrane protein